MAKTPTVKEMQAALASRQYKDAPTGRLEDWKWNPLAEVQKKLAMEREIPDYIQKGYGGFMNEQLAKAKAGQLSPRDLIKAYAITQSSIGRGGLSHGTATKAGMKLPNTGGEVRPEGAFAEWLGSPMGQRYMDAAERGELHQPALEDLRAKFAPFGKQNEQVNAMIYAAQTLPGKAAGINQAISGPTNEFRDYAEGLKGIAGAKSGFIGSLLGRGDLPTLDARQLNLHAGKAPVGVGAIMKRGKGQGAREAVDRLAARQRAMGFAVDPSMEPHYQHLAHHAVWDKAADTQTTHEDLVKALRGYADGGDVEAMRQQLAASQPAGHLEHLPRRPNPAVGSRYDVRAPTGLVPKKKVSLRDFRGASAMLMPWDSSSRNVAIHGISGHELPEPVITHGGHDFARDEEHVRQGIIGASGDEISKRIATREAIARMENQKAGGTGQILHLPSTMGDYAEGFANTPAELAYQLHKRANLHPAESEELANIIRNTNAKTGPFRGFVGFTDPVAYAHQIRTGAGLANPAKAGELRKAINMKIIHGKRAQQLMGFNAEDVQNAMLDPALRGVPKGFFGNAVMSSDPEHMTLTPLQSNRDPYNTRFSGKYEGTLGQNLPFGALFGSKIPKLEQEFEYKKRKEGMHGPLQLNTGDMRNMVIGALEKRNPRVSQILDNKTLDQLDEFMRRRDQWMKTGHYAAGGKVEPDLDEMRLANTLRKPKKKALDIRSVGVDEAPDMAVKTYVSPGLGKATTLPIGGVDFSPMMPGQQITPGAGTPGQPQPPQQQGGLPGAPPSGPPAGPPGSEVPMGGPAPGVAPVGQSAQTPQSNILAMTRQGQALRALSPVLPPPKKKAAGGVVGSRNFQDGGEVGYRGEHGAPGPGAGSPMHNVTGTYPADFYGSKGFGYYADMGQPYDRESYDAVMRAKDKPEKLMWAYRAVPLDVHAAAMKTNEPLQHMIRPGDWVSTSKKYAQEHGEGALQGKYKIAMKRVPASHLYTSGDSIHEWGYNPVVKKATGGVVNMAGGSKEANLRAMREEILQQKGQYGARRLDRAADEIRNLSKLYTQQALREAFTGDNAQAIMSMNPAHFERYAKPLPEHTIRLDPETIAARRAYDAREGTHQLKLAMPTGDYIQHLIDVARQGSFDDVPYLKIDKEEAGLPITPHLVGHEGRHRNRALAAMGQKKGLVRLFPRSELREPLPRRSQEEYIDALRKEVPGNMVTPETAGERREYIRRSAIALPDFYNKGGSVEQMSAELREKGKQKFLEQSAVKDVMYHGTNKDITSFDPAKSHRHTAWFTGAPEHANKFVAGGRRNMGAKATKGSAVYPVHLSIKNPLNLTKFPPGTLLTMPELLAHAGLPNDQDALRSIAAQALSSRYAGVGSHIADPVSHIAEGYSRPARVNDMLDNPALINAFKAAGYDGLQQVEDNAKTYATFHPTQVKSATGNRGTYDTSSPDITKKDGGKVTLPASKEQMERELKRASHFKQKV